MSAGNILPKEPETLPEPAGETEETGASAIGALLEGLETSPEPAGEAKETGVSAIGALLEGLKTQLEPALAPAVVTCRYPYQRRRLPPDRPVVWLGVEKLTAPGGPFAPWLGADGGAVGRELELVARVEILDRLDGDACHRLFGQLCQALLLEERRPWVRELSCGPLTFDREAGAFRLVCKGTLRGVLAREEKGQTLRNIIIEKEEKP